MSNEGGHPQVFTGQPWVPLGDPHPMMPGAPALPFFPAMTMPAPGCVCPPGSEATCQAPVCYRRGGPPAKPLAPTLECHCGFAHKPDCAACAQYRERNEERRQARLEKFRKPGGSD
jgi:hypothetical protein